MGEAFTYGERVSPGSTTAARRNVDTPGPLGAPRPAERVRRAGPFVRWPRTADAVLAAVVFVLTTTVTEGPGDTLMTRSVQDVPVPALLAFAVASAALYRRRHEPLVVLAVVLVCFAATLDSGFADAGGTLLIGLYSVGRYARSQQRGIVGVLVAIVLIAVDGLLAGLPWGEVVVSGVAMEVAWSIGRRLRLRGERAVALQREKDVEAHRIVMEERTRIARELHDVVAHRVSSMTVQAGAAKAVAARDPEAALRAMTAVEEAGREALGELRHLLGVLRLEADLDGAGPQPGLQDLPRLVEQTRRAGLEVTLSTDGVASPLPARVELSAYRIVQESLTNVLKHAGPGARADVTLQADRRRLVVEVLDDGAGVTGEPGSGHGIVGMRERATLLGGRLLAGPRPRGGYLVRAELPIDGDAS